MKFRVRHGRNTQLLEISDEGATVGRLLQAIRDTVLSTFHIGQDAAFDISVNKKDLLSDQEKLLQDYGIVSGDLIWIHLAEGSATTCGAAATSSRADNDRARSFASTLHECAAGSSVSVQTPSGSQARQMEDTVAAPKTLPTSPPLVTLCGDSEAGRVPELLQRAYEQAQVTSANDALTVALHVFMIEAGFEDVKQDQEECDQARAALPSSLPEGWRKCGAYMLKYVHPLCHGATCKLTCIPIGEILVVNACVNASETTLSVNALNLTPSSYVLVEGAAPAKEASHAYKALSLLSRTFKDSVASPALSLMRQALGLPCSVGLLALPVELQVQVLLLLPVKDVLAVGLASRSLSQLIADSSLWRSIFLRDYGDSAGDELDQDWKQVYIERHHLAGLATRERQYIYAHLWSEPAPMPRRPIQPAAPFPPGIIGGAYDLWPDPLVPRFPGDLPAPRQRLRMWDEPPRNRQPQFPPDTGL